MLLYITIFINNKVDELIVYSELCFSENMSNLKGKGTLQKFTKLQKH